MRIFKLKMVVSWLLVLLFSGCVEMDMAQQQWAQQPVNTATPMPIQPLYILTVAGDNDLNELIIIDPTTWSIARRTTLLPVAAWELSRDPQGRIWIGYGAEPGVDHSVQVFSPEGKLLKTFSLCSDPTPKIHFADGKAFVPCLQNGFHAAVAIVDLNSLEVMKTIDVGTDANDFMLLATGGNTDYFALVGGGSLLNSGKANLAILMKTDSFKILSPVEMPAGNYVVILSYQDRFFIPNAVPNIVSGKRQDLFVVNTQPEPSFTIQELPATGSLWATISGNFLYVYHNPEGTLLRTDPMRAISRTDLTTNQSELWHLPINGMQEISRLSMRRSF